ncbi:LysE family translocator [Picrophilus oshimae]|uniref:Threonine/homoserine/homoserine lactone efflux protein n=1 Tax=Picrophilus torridus (strain ATCC 700027 / DSM 9790 / JCM 10055 / NBRC 100828 / KAW 2/3) TaxID=1122961 RepID=A0A8G2L767_PICTO|nr:LysE family translocator [Picrophilus oshimae]SMD30733.1 Threonine/homoserine/homoserine lactone efflux protein [Picrophilus oshimae DSM 9789]
MFYIYFLGIALGLSLAAPPGPVNSVIAHESLKSKIHGSNVGFGAMTADFTFFLIIYFLKSIINVYIIRILYIAGGLLMIYLAYGIIRSRMPSSSKGGNYIIGLIMGLTNPFQITWWITAGIFLVREFSILIIIGLFSGIIVWCTVFPYLINKFGYKYERYINIFSFAVILGFGLYILYSGINLLIKP